MGAKDCAEKGTKALTKPGGTAKGLGVLPMVREDESVALKILRANPDGRMNFRRMWKMWLMDPRTVRVMEYAALTNRRFLAKIMDKAYPTPQTVSTSGDDNRSINLTLGVQINQGDGQPVVLTTEYKPMGRVPNVADPLAHKRLKGSDD